MTIKKAQKSLLILLFLVFWLILQVIRPLAFHLVSNKVPPRVAPQFPEGSRRFPKVPEGSRRSCLSAQLTSTAVENQMEWKNKKHWKWRTTTSFYLLFFIYIYIYIFFFTTPHTPSSPPLFSLSNWINSEMNYSLGCVSPPLGCSLLFIPFGYRGFEFPSFSIGWFSGISICLNGDKNSRISVIFQPVAT